MHTPERGPKPDLAGPNGLRNATLERNNARLRIGLQYAQAIIDAQKFLCTLLVLPSVAEMPQNGVKVTFHAELSDC